MSTLTVIIGAGASYDCVDRNVVDLDESWTPPLVNELFSPRPSFSGILKNYPKAEALSGEIRRVLTKSQGKGWLPLEQLLRDFSNDNHPAVRRRVREVPFYLQELLGEISRKYILHGRSLFHELAAEIATAIHRRRYESVLFLTVNYDLFLDRELEILFNHRFRQMGDYISATEWKLVKLHGSVNWGYRITAGKLDAREECLDVVAKLESEPHPETHDIVLLPHHQTYCRDGHHLYPAIAVPIADKSGFCCLSQLSKAARDHIATSTDFLVLGCRLADQDLLDLINSAENAKRLKIVDAGLESSLEILNRLGDHCSAFRPFKDTGTHLHPTGFSRFVTEGGLRQFLTQQP